MAPFRLRAQPLDQLGKQIGHEALGPSGPTVAYDESSPDAQHADLRHEPDPAREAERARLGLLRRLAAILCLIEIYGHAPDEDEVLVCVGKLIAFRQRRARFLRQKRAPNARREKQAEGFVRPFLWIIAAGRPTAVLVELGATSVPGFPQGVYFGPGRFRVGVVVTSELPRDRSSQEFIVTMQNTWEKARAEGRAEEAARAVLTVLRVRGIEVPELAHDRILAQKDLERLERWLEKAAVTASVAEVLDEPS